jgi:IS5 family transposase
LGRKINEISRNIGRVSASKNGKKQVIVESLYSNLLNRTQMLLARAKELEEQAAIDGHTIEVIALGKQLKHWIELTEQVCDTARRRVLLGEDVPNGDKLFSLFEPHTQLYRRGKAGMPNQFGRLVLIFEDGAGFISHYQLMDREALDKDVIVEQTQEAQRKHGGEIKKASFDRGFYSPENEIGLSEIVDVPCLPPRHPKQYAEKLSNASVAFRTARQRHSGVEAAIGALQRGNGLERCRDRSELGFERYLGLAVLGRNIHTLGKLVISLRQAKAKSAFSKRQAA